MKDKFFVPKLLDDKLPVSKAIFIYDYSNLEGLTTLRGYKIEEILGLTFSGRVSI